MGLSLKKKKRGLPVSVIALASECHSLNIIVFYFMKRLVLEGTKSGAVH